MEALNKERKSVRMLITKTVRGLDTDLAAQPKDVINLRTKLGKLVSYEERIAPLDKAIIDVILADPQSNDEQYEAEVTIVDEYAENLLKAKIMVEMALDEESKENARENQSFDDDLQSVRSTNQKRYKLPKIELQKFSGKIIDWLSWWAFFEKIHIDNQLSAADKFQYLRQCVEEKTRAHDLVNAFPASAANYPKAVAALTERFGNKKLLTQVYIRELFQMGLENVQNKPGISSMYDKLVGHLRSLETLGVTVEQSTLFLYPMVESSLPEDIIIAWQRSSLYERDGSAEQPPKGNLDYLIEFLRQEVEREEQRSLMKNGFFESKEKSTTTKKPTAYATAAGLHVNSNSKPTCGFCGKDHPSQVCYSAKAMSLDERWKVIKDKKLCTKCLKSGHWALQCEVDIKCDLCQKNHYRIICSKNNQSKVVKSNSGSNNATNTLVLLKTIMITVATKDGPTIVRAIFDDGSHRSYITKSLANRTKGREIGKFFERNILFGGILSDVEERTIFEVSVGPLNKKPNIRLELADKEVITGEIDKLPAGYWQRELKEKGIWINDMESDSQEPEILIGGDLIPALTTDRSVTLKCGLKAIETVFGWTIIGPIPQTNQTCLSLAMTVTSNQIDESEVRKLWQLDTIGIRDPVEVKTIEQRNKETKEHFSKTVTRQEDGRYQVALPWANGKQIIPNNFEVAAKRLTSTTKKLKAIGMYGTYNDLLKQWEKENFIDRIEMDNPLVVKFGHFIPHHAVYKPESKTTPVRPVFDASCKSGRHPSLNECLEKGPNLIELLPTTIIRFREHRIGVLADIRKAFQMIEVHGDDQYSLLFLWWEDDSCTKMVVFKHKRVVFGLKSSPFILAAIIEKHLDDVSTEDKELAMKLKKSLYVDNSVTSVDSVEDYRQFKSKAIKLMADAQMELRQWESSWMESESEAVEQSDEMVTSVLGLKWCKKTDTLFCASFPVMPDQLTRRTLLATINKIYDPMGILSPALVWPKLILQMTWKLKLSWDESLLPDLEHRFKKWCGAYNYLEKIRIPRFMKGESYSKESSKEQLHVFCDASALAYAAVVFMRTKNEDGVTVQLVQSKARVAPIGRVTIPRLELIGCNIGARLGSSVKSTLEKDIPCFYWSDSTTALAWINRNDEWGTFVGNRVREILTTAKAIQWKYVPGKLNPADLPSRGCSQKQLLDSIWWEGPSWLKRPSSEWPSQSYCVNEDEVNSERKKIVQEEMSLSNIPTIVDQPWFAKKNSYIINLRGVAWLKRFRHNSLAGKNNVEKKIGPLSIHEIFEAEDLMIRLVQQQTFQPNMKFIAGLRVTEDNGNYVVVTKILNRRDTGRFRKPWLLPSNHPITKQLIIEEHLRYGHAGVLFLASILREKFWIVKMKKTIDSVIKKCTVCIRHGKSPTSVPASPLPENRVKNAKVFEISGIDLAGPLYLRDNSKQWVVLFTCAVVRAVHLELVEQINTEHFIMALERFIYRRGRVLVIYTDNGTNFHGTANLFGKINWEKVQSKFRLERITWIFIPPAAPWWGGFWERMVRTMKEYLRKILGHNKLTKVELDTAICFVESLINGRPLTPVTEDPSDLSPITPAQFIQDIQSSDFPEVEGITGKKMREKLCHLVQVKQELRSRFRTEYLGQLIERSKENKYYEFKVGELVIVQVDNKKRLDWPLARIMELFPGNDGIVRVARLKTSSGEVTRALNHLVPLELEGASLDIESKKSVKKQDDSEKTVLNKPIEDQWQETSEVEQVTRTRSGRQVKPVDRLGFSRVAK